MNYSCGRPLMQTKRTNQTSYSSFRSFADIELEDNESVEKLKANVLGALQEVIAHRKPPSNALQHLNELLLCLPLIRQVDVVIRKYWNQVRLDNKVPMNKLFIEMLESNYSTIAFFK